VFLPQHNKSVGNKLESELSTNYTNGANVLSACVTTTETAAQVTKAGADAFDKVMKDAVAGTNGAQHVNLNTAAGRSAFYPVFVQAYPDIAGQTALFNRLMDIAVSCQVKFSNYQTNVQSHVDEYNKWKNGSFWVRGFGGGGFPNENMYVAIPGHHLTGEAAWIQIQSPIVENSVVGTYTTSVQQVPDLGSILNPPTSTNTAPAPAPSPSATVKPKATATSTKK